LPWALRTRILSLKGHGVEQGVVRQSFSHGRTKAIVVEKVKSRTPARAKADTATPEAVPTDRSGKMQRGPHQKD